MQETTENPRKASGVSLFHLFKKRLVSPRSSASFLVVKTQSQCSASAFAFGGVSLDFYMLRLSETRKGRVYSRESRFSCSSARAYCVKSTAPMLPRPAGVFLLRLNPIARRRHLQRQI